VGKLRLAVITDIHWGPDSGARLGSKAPKLMEAFIKAINKYKNKPDGVVDMGDRLTSRRHDDALQSLKGLKDCFNRIAAPVYHLTGNHDVRHLSRAENEAITGSPGASYSKDINGYHLIFWNPSVSLAGKDGMHIEQADMDWLRADLAAADKPAIVFSHVPLDNTGHDDLDPEALKDNPWITKDTPRAAIEGRFFYGEGPEARKLMEESGKVILCMAGHAHRNRYQNINGIHYITQQSLTQTYQKKYRVPTHAWSMVDFEDGKITVRLKGHAPMRIQGRMLRTYTLAAKPVLQGPQGGGDTPALGQ
jgi:Icc protein